MNDREPLNYATPKPKKAYDRFEGFFAAIGLAGLIGALIMAAAMVYLHWLNR